jgi:predicted ATPase
MSWRRGGKLEDAVDIADWLRGLGLGATGTRLSAPFDLALLAEALALAGKIEEGLAALDDALAQAAVSGVRGWDAEIHRLRGELTGRLPYSDPAKAEESFRTALAIARAQGTRGCELRAATSLARLRLVHRRLRHRRPEGREAAARSVGVSPPSARPRSCFSIA